MAFWPKKSNFEGITIFLGAKTFLGYPIFGFLTFEFWHANFVMFLIKKNQKNPSKLDFFGQEEPVN